MNALLLALSFGLNYPAMRMAAAAGCRVHVLGRDGASGLRFSRYCDSFQLLNFIPGAQPLDAVLAEIERAAKNVKADVLLPSDIVSTRILSELAPRLPVPTYPLPPPEVFDVMNSKWDFYHFCIKHGVPTPETMQFDDMTAFKQALKRGVMPLPVVVKPLDAQAKKGIHPILSEKDLPILDTLDHKPALMQRYVAGQWVGINILADHGRILAYTVQRNLADCYAFQHNEKLLKGVTRIVEASGYHGAANFDAMEDAANGEIYFLECNPRFWMSIFASHYAGINFIKAGLNMKALDPAKPLAVPDIDIPRPKAVVKKFFRQGSVNAMDIRLLNYILADPIGKLCGNLPWFSDESLSAIEGHMALIAALKTGKVS